MVICKHNIGMEFGIEKCAKLIMKSGKRETTESNNETRKICRKSIENENHFWEYWKLY